MLRVQGNSSPGGLLGNSPQRQQLNLGPCVIKSFVLPTTDHGARLMLLIQEHLRESVNNPYSSLVFSFWLWFLL